LLGLLLALVPMLSPVLARGSAAGELDAPRRRRQRLLYLAAGLGLAASFPLETLISVRAGLLLRGAVCLVTLVAGGRLWQAGTRSGLHRWFFRVSLWAVPLGLLAGGLAPDKHIPLAHVTYVGGFALATLAISAHVAMLHTSAARLADRNPWLVVAAGGLTLVAAVARLAVESSAGRIFLYLGIASGAWLAASLAWAAFLAPRVVDPGGSA
jgi:hypothetical protein